MDDPPAADGSPEKRPAGADGPGYPGQDDGPGYPGQDPEPTPEMRDIARTCFDWAREGATASLELYLSHGVPADLTDGAGNTLLMLAAYHGHADTVGALLARGADVDRLNDRGQSPLAGAIFKGEDGVVRVLLRAGADLDHGAPTARATAAMFGREDLVGDR